MCVCILVKESHLSLPLSLSASFNSAMDRPQCTQEIVVKPMDQEIVAPNSTNSNNNTNNSNNPSKKEAPHVNCPRCDSTNTKFCYYNNYKLSQPRYFCKTCRRYWTKGETLRNTPVGGGSRKNKRSSSSSSSSYDTSKKLPHDLFVPPASPLVLSQYFRAHHPGQQRDYGQDLNLGFALTTTNLFKNVSHEFLQVPNNLASTTTTGSAQFSAAMNSFMPIPNPMMPGFKIPMMPEFYIPSLSIGSLMDGMNANGNGGLHQEGNAAGGRLLFPLYEELKANTETTHDDEQRRDDEDEDVIPMDTGMESGVEDHGN